MSDLVSTFRSYALDKDNCPRMNTEVVYVRVGLLKEAADRIEQLEAALREAGCDHCRHWFDRAALGEERT